MSNRSTDAEADTATRLARKFTRMDWKTVSQPTAMSNRIRRLRWMLADWLSFAACKLRGHKWYVADTFHGVAGNRAAELNQQIWQAMVGLVYPVSKEDSVTLERIRERLDELGQRAGENWGHLPKCK